MEQKSKKILIGICAGALVAAVSVGGTLSYLHTSTEIRVNNFTFATDGLKAILTEPDWDGVIDYEDDLTPIYGEYVDDDNDPSTPDVLVPVSKRPDKKRDGTLYGEDSSQNMVPGASVSKNPMITNTCKYDEWVAMKITFVYSEKSDKAGQPLEFYDLDELLKVIDINYGDYVMSMKEYNSYKTLTDEEKAGLNEEQIDALLAKKAEELAADPRMWVRPADGGDAKTGTQVFYYRGILKGSPDGTKIGNLMHTTPIFDTVTVDKNASNGAIQYLMDMKGFAIWIQGYAVQSAQYETVDEWLNSTVAFANDVSKETPGNVERPGILPGGPVEEVSETETL